MPSLKDIKGRISSVKSTLKITSAMKMVSSAKLRGAQTAIENMLPYEASLQHILSLLPSVKSSSVGPVKKVAVVAFSSNSSLCGGFNSNVIRETRSRIDSLRAEGADVVVFPVGKKIAEALKRDGFDIPSDYSAIVGKPEYESASSMAGMLKEKFEKSEFDRVELVYNHFVTTSSQTVVRETFLPFETPSVSADSSSDEGFILEPGAEELLERLLPKVICLKIYTVVLDTVAAEHAARTVAMQTATENAEELLGDLTLQYNKTRQNKITSEILDIVGGTLA